jgi:hypothetical protein
MIAACGFFGRTLGATFFATGFFATGFFATGFLTAGFFAADFFGIAFFAASFFAAVFLAKRETALDNFFFRGTTAKASRGAQ